MNDTSLSKKRIAKKKARPWRQSAQHQWDDDLDNLIDAFSLAEEALEELDKGDDDDV